jgi:DNA-binding NarL/FixJ family response regulator
MKINTIRVVIVDDHHMVRETWKMILQSSEGIDVIGECSSGAEAIASAASLNPDIMLMDINMAPVNGFEATRKILKTNSSIKIIGVSVNNQPGYAKNLIQLGAKGYVTKNSSKEEMVKAIEEVMKGKTYICQEIQDRMDDPK